MSEQQDLILVEKADKVLQQLYNRYEEADEADKWMMEPSILKAREALLNARLALFKQGVITTSEDLQKLDKIKEEIDNAANTQALIMTAAKFAVFLSTFI
ncbi:hypothetical protein [Halarcobacter anaerophilus]|jgi:tRNA uridine 5-carbamoylmethylation protein Kti12|uniref:Uncharacterized protein n=1 Tax=Halarcobacter anaerophilus TaxID=877500 RepID=A0A4Q0Y342_9BACT|nr:hypothetical protein [Halarcobacter anaerophilus]QDF29308.1 hypothetical protein AANAER_1834 [Halarcobacter anaerophilus]RXJ64556.1 hypothetical protein CRV06_00955 [Halarcobacter anaerophilus]